MIEAIGTHIIEVADSTQQPRAYTLREMARRVARVINAEDDDEMLATAMDGIRWAISYADITRHMQFGRSQQASVALTENSRTVTLPQDFFGVRQVELLYSLANTSRPTTMDASTEGVYALIPHEPWNVFSSMNPDLKGDIPLAWSAKNTFTDGTLYLRPRFTADAAVDWKIRITYDTPTDLPDSPTDIIAAPRDYSTVVVEGAKYYLLFERKSDDPMRYRHQFSIFEQMIGRFGAHETKRHGQDHACWRIGDL